VPFAGNNDELVAINTVDQSVGMVDPPRPVTEQFKFQRFRFAQPSERGAGKVARQFMDIFRFVLVSCRTHAFGVNRAKKRKAGFCQYKVYTKAVLSGGSHHVKRSRFHHEAGA